MRSIVRAAAIATSVALSARAQPVAPVVYRVSFPAPEHRFAVVEAGSAQMIHLVLFSYAFFFKGLTGLAVTIGCIITLFIVMQLTARVRWAEKFAPSAAQA